MNFRKRLINIAVGGGVLAMCALFALPAVAAAKDDGKAHIEFEGTVHDFGTVKEDGGPVTCEFEFENTGSKNLVIIDAKAECGCTRPEFPQSPVAPGKKGKISVTYHPLGRPGGFDKVVTVKTNGKPAKARLRIRGTVMPKTK